MGLLDLLRRLRKSTQEARILILGLDNAGKTSILKHLADEEPANMSPTQGFNVKTVVTQGFKLNVWDIGGQRSVRPYWKNYYDNTDVLIFVIDSADRERIPDAAGELNLLLLEAKLAGVPLLVFANKQDLITAMPASDIAKNLKLHLIRERDYFIQACSAKDGRGLDDGLKWCLTEIQERRRRGGKS